MESVRPVTIFKSIVVKTGNEVTLYTLPIQAGGMLNVCTGIDAIYYSLMVSGGKQNNKERTTCQCHL